MQDQKTTRRKGIRKESLTDSQVLLEGSIHLNGLHTSTLTSDDLEVLRTTLEQEVSNIVEDDDGSLLSGTVEVDSWSPIESSTNMSSVSRKLDTKGLNSFEVLVRLSAPSDVFGEDNPEVLCHNLNMYLHHSMDSGLFMARLVSEIRDGHSLGSIQSVAFNKLTIVSNRYQSESDKMINVLSMNTNLIVYGLVIGTLVGIGAAIIMYMRAKPILNNKDNNDKESIKHVRVMKSLHTVINILDREILLDEFTR